MELPEFYKGKKVLITGHTGFKGSWLTEILTQAGAEVTGYSLRPPTQPSLFEIAGLEDTIDNVYGDIRDLAHLKSVFERVNPEIVFHMA
ncbi:MAG: GDP-mannose 4,6-dehydratase, partial [Clostridium sp.]